jgi:hypothetical protein
MDERPNFRDTEHLYKVFDYILNHLLSDPEIGPKLASTKLIVQWVYHDPDGVVTFNLKDRPREGFYADWALGSTEWKPDVITYKSSTFGLAFLQGRENPLAGMVRGKIKAKGNVMVLMKMLPLGRQMARLVRHYLRDMGEGDLVIPRKQ